MRFDSARGREIGAAPANRPPEGPSMVWRSTSGAREGLSEQTRPQPEDREFDAKAVESGAAGENRARSIATYIFGRPSLACGIGILVAYAVVGLAAPLLTQADPSVANSSQIYRQPGGAHLFGTDRFGMDVYARTLYAARLDLMIAFVSVALSCASGMVLGAIAGYLGGAVDWLLMRSIEVLQAFPTLVLAIAVLAAVGQSITGVVLVIAAVGLPYYVRLVRGQIRSLRASPMAESARASGATPVRVMLRHLLPNAAGPALAYASVNAAWSVMIAASLGFLGLGVRIPDAEWGLMISLGAQSILTGQWWVVVFPGVALAGLVAGCYLLSDGLQDLLDPRVAV